MLKLVETFWASEGWCIPLEVIWGLQTPPKNSGHQKGGVHLFRAGSAGLPGSAAGLLGAGGQGCSSTQADNPEAGGEAGEGGSGLPVGLPGQGPRKGGTGFCGLVWKYGGQSFMSNI